MSESQASLPVVAIVGRPNVGKSTLFNRLVGRRLAIVMDTPGVTRDRNYLAVEWGRLHFTLVDTGGVDPADLDALGQDVGTQSLKTLPEADVVLFMTDAREGVSPVDQEVADALRRHGARVLHLVNKADTETLFQTALEASALGFETVIPVSAEHSRGLDDLYDELARRLPLSEEPFAEKVEEEDPTIRVAVVGRPNVGKSTLVNRLLGEDRLVVSNIPGTTRDAIDSEMTVDGTTYLFIDTAGIRRRGRIEKGVERASIGRTMEAVARAEVAVLLMDAEEGVTEPDTKIAGQILKAMRGCVLVINKWDTQKGDEEARARQLHEMNRLFPFLSHAPVVFLSGLSGYRVQQLFPAINLVAEAFRRRIGTGELNRAIEELVARQPPPMSGRRPVRIYYATQVGAAPPRIVLFTNKPEGLQAGYLRYLENGLRKAFDFTGTPVIIQLRHRDKEKRGKKRR